MKIKKQKRMNENGKKKEKRIKEKIKINKKRKG